MNAARVFRILHAALIAGVVLMGAALVVVRRLGLSHTFDGAATIGLVLAGVGFVHLAVAMLVLRSRVPERRPDQSPDAYWMEGASRGTAIVLWGVVQAAGFLAAVGYFLAGGAAPVLVGAGALMALVLFRPSRLEGTE